MLSRNRFCLLDGKIHDKSPDHHFDLNLFESMIHTINFQEYVQSFFALSCRSASKKFFSLCCSIFLSFCPCFYFRSFANLKLAFLWKNFLEGKRNSIPSGKYLFAVEENYFIRVLTSLISLQ